jgi:hypothetical protein
MPFEAQADRLAKSWSRNSSGRWGGPWPRSPQPGACSANTSTNFATAFILARVFGNNPDFWLNVRRRSDLWEAMNSPKERERIERAKPSAEAMTTPALLCTEIPYILANGERL